MRLVADVSTTENTNGEQPIAQKETAALRRTKVFMFAVLTLSALAVGLGVYSFIRTSEQSEFETQFDDLAEKCLDAVGRSLYQTLGAVDALLFNCAAYARSSPTDNWPFVTVPDFGIRAAKVLSLSDGLFLALYPFVRSAQRDAWEDYTATHKEWVRKSGRVGAVAKGRCVNGGCIASISSVVWTLSSYSATFSTTHSWNRHLRSKKSTASITSPRCRPTKHGTSFTITTSM